MDPNNEYLRMLVHSEYTVAMHIIKITVKHCRKKNNNNKKKKQQLKKPKTTKKQQIPDVLIWGYYV